MSSNILHILVLFIIIKGLEAVRNLAVGKHATQSSNYYENTADKAVDGNPDKHFNRGSCAHTSCGDKSPWWMVDLGNIYEIISITIHNSLSANGRMRNFKMYVYKKHPRHGTAGELCAEQDATALPQGKIVTYACQKPIRGRYVRIVKKFKTYCDALILCEVIVNGDDVFDCPEHFVQRGSTKSCYFYSRHSAGNWFQARDICKALRADLATADTKEKVQFLKAGLGEIGKLSGRIYYLGGHAFTGGLAFKWLNPKAISISVFDDWDKSTNPKDPEPNLEDEFCFGMHREHDFSWHNIHCTRRAYFICEVSRNWP